MTTFDQRRRIRDISKKILRDPNKSKTAMTAKGLTIVQTLDGSTREYPVIHDLFSKLIDIVYTYEGKISVAECIGTIELVKDEIKQNSIIVP